MAPKILIVEDDSNISNLLFISLSGRGYDLYTASDGQEALERMGELKPDLLITDVMMPRMNGYQLVHTLTQERYDIPTPKIIILTSRTDEEDVKKGLKVGADMYIPKPFDVQEIPQRVKELLSGEAVK